MSNSFYVYETQHRHNQGCDTCKKGMVEGYLFEETGETFCSVLCASLIHGARGSAKLIDEGLLFWTTWYDEES